MIHWRFNDPCLNNKNTEAAYSATLFLLRPCFIMSTSLNQQARRSKRQIDSLVGKVNDLLYKSIYKNQSFTKEQVEQALQNATGRNDQERIDNAVDTLIFNKTIALSSTECNVKSPPSVNTTANTNATADYENTKNANSKSCQHMHQKIDSSIVSEQTDYGSAIIKTNNDTNEPSPQSIHSRSSQTTSSKTNNTKFDTLSTVGGFTNYNEIQLEYFSNINDASTSNDSNNSKLLSSGLESVSGATKSAVSGSSKIESRKQKRAPSTHRMGTRSRQTTGTGVEDENNTNGTESPPKSGAVVPLPSKVFSPHKSSNQASRSSIPKSLNFDRPKSNKKKASPTAAVLNNVTSGRSDKELGICTFRGFTDYDIYQCQEKNMKDLSTFPSSIWDKDPLFQIEIGAIARGKTSLASIGTGYGDEVRHKRCIKDAEEKHPDIVDLKQFVIASNEGTNKHGNQKRGNTLCTICLNEFCCYTTDSGFSVDRLRSHASSKKCKAAKQLRKEKNIRKGVANEKMRLRLALAEESYPEIKGLYSPIDNSTDKVECRCGTEMKLRDHCVDTRSLDPFGLKQHSRTKTCNEKRKVSSS